MNLIGRGAAPPTVDVGVEFTDRPEGPERFTLGDAPFWPVDRLVEPDAWAGHIPFAFWIVAALRPRLLVELGTHSGNSYLAFLQAAHRLGLDTACFAVDTWQGDAQAGYYGEEVFEELARYHERHYGAFSRLVRSTFDEAVQHFPDGSVDLLHVDGYHTYEASAHDFAAWTPKLSTRAVVLLHDINVREGDFGVWRLWDELRTRYPHFEFRHAHGLGVLGVGSELPAAVTALWLATGDGQRASRVRDVFARLGGSLVEGMKLQNEVDRLAEALRTAAREAAARDELIRRDAAERASLEEATRMRNQAHAAEIAEHRRLISELQHEIVRLGTLRDGLQEHVRGLERERTEASGEIETLRAALSALHGSRSVRVTRPLRQAGAWCRVALAWTRRGPRSP